MIVAGDQIVLKTGAVSITMKKNGDIVIQGEEHHHQGKCQILTLRRPRT